MLEGMPVPDLWYADEVTQCGARVLALSGDGDLLFVGRSMDSMFDLLCGALAETTWARRPQILPLSLTDVDALSAAEIDQVRANLARSGLTPAEMMRRKRPVTFVDLVFSGGTFEQIFTLIARWTAEQRAQWDVVRQKLRFVGITRRTHTSPNTWRWQQHSDWPRQLPAAAIANVSMDSQVWSFLGNQQFKASLSFRPEHWFDEAALEPQRDEDTRWGLAQAVGMFERGRQPETRGALAKTLSRTHTISEPWLRSLALELRN
jgi:hypothetical protein